ncbi:MAG: hypothetical protein AABX54_03705 [Nanoarchaeota archaeon]
MLDEKSIKQAKYNAEQLIREGKISKDSEGRYARFFLKNSQDSFNTAKLLFLVSSDKNKKIELGYPNFNGYLWVINSSYYSMFYMARALLENSRIKIITDQSIHSTVYFALIYYFYLTGKIEKSLIEEFKNANIDSTDILGKEKAKELMQDYHNEKEKRGRFTYEMGEIAMQNKAKTSLERAMNFNEKIRTMIRL